MPKLYKLPKYMLMNGATSSDTGHEEFRVAIVEGTQLDNFFVGHLGQEQLKGNIYKAEIASKVPSLEAYFVNYGAEKHGFLPYKEVANNYFLASADTSEDNRPFGSDQLSEGQKIMVQIAKDERGTKGAALTTEISLAGIYIVIMPNSPKAGGISRQIEGQNREKIREILNALPVPENMGIIIRTAGVDKNLEELKWDLSILLKHWEAIQQAYQEKNEPFLIHQESNIIIRAIRDYMREDIDEIYVDNLAVYETVLAYVNQVRPDFIPRIKLYQSHIPLFSRFQIESQIEDVFKHEVRLPSGGAIVIDHTEALVSIDVNSARATRGVDIEETALNTNCEAADEIARQLRIRDTGGLIVIDFIDMFSNRHQREVEERLKRALEFDRARVQIGRISKFGLLEMSRQRLRTSLGEITAITCPRCSGHGTVRTIPSLTLSILRLIEEESLKDSIREIRAQLPVDVATYLLNEKRDSLLAIEKLHEVKIWIIPNVQLTAPHFKIDGIRGTDQKVLLKSYELPETPPSEAMMGQDKKDKRPIQEPAIKSISIANPHPPKESLLQSKSWFKRLADYFLGEKLSSTKEKTPSADITSARASRLSPISQPQRFQKNTRQPSFQKNARSGGSSQSRYQKNKENNYRENKDLRNNRDSRDNKDHREKNRSQQISRKSGLSEMAYSAAEPISKPLSAQHGTDIQQIMPLSSQSINTESSIQAASPPHSHHSQSQSISEEINAAKENANIPDTQKIKEIKETQEIKEKTALDVNSSNVDSRYDEESSAVSDIAKSVDSPVSENSFDQTLRPYNTHKRRGRHLRRGGGNSNYRYKQDPPPDENP